jgi:small GTP-binding protein
MPKQLRTYPKFAVVGHPNKGKSSIVSSLAQDDSVQISDTPGTTTKSRSFPLRVDGEIIYELFDTPGFQRARRVLSWLQAQETPAHQRAQAVQAFIAAHLDDPKYNDEIELLRPIMEGAGILYVVDGSRPYGEEYEAEMEILRWTGQPSMALINHIGAEDYSSEWRLALEQYFRIVRVYDPMETDPQQHIHLLEAMAQLDESWRAALKHSVTLFEAQRSQKFEQSAKTITYLVQSSLSYIAQRKIKGEDATQVDKEALLEEYQTHLRELEQKSQRFIERLWSHQHLDKEQTLLHFESIDLFSKESASLFGLSRQEMMVMGATGGAVAGAGIDLLFAGHTLLIGGAIGAVVGGVGAYFGFEELSDIKLLGRRMGSRYLEIGPMENRNFPYILLGRALYHLHIISARSHATRAAMSLTMDEGFKAQWLDEDTKKPLEKHHAHFRSGKESEAERIKAYEALVSSCLKRVV